MVITNYGLTQIAIRLGSNVPAIAYCGIGTGSQTVSTSTIALANETDRNFRSNLDLGVPKQVGIETDFSTIEMSGTQLREFGTFSASGISTGSCWQVAQLNAPISFDGTNELKVVVSFTVY